MFHSLRHQIRARAGLFALVTWFAVGCEPVQFGEETETPVDSAAGFASLTLVNHRETDPGALVLQLYPSGAQSVEDARIEKAFPPVAFEDQAVLQVPEGDWKLAYKMESGDVRPMPGEDEEGLADDWPVVGFTKGKAYRLEISTNTANHTVWSHNLPVK